MRFDKKKGSLLIETLIAMAILAIVLTSIIQSLLVSLHAAEKIRDSFEASVLLENLLFEIKNDEKGETYARTHEDDLPGYFVSPNDYSYKINSTVIGSTKKAWGQQTLYQDFKVQVNWKQGQDFLVGNSVARTRVQIS